MENSMSQMQNTAKSFFKRPEGKTGIVFIVGLGLLGVWAGVKLLPWVILALQNLLTAGLLFVGVFVFFYVVFSQRVRTLAWFGFRKLMRTLTSILIKIDPIAIMKDYVISLKKHKDNMTEQITAINGQMKNVEMKINQYKNDTKKEMNMMVEAKKQGKEMLAKQSERSVGRYTESAKTLNILLNKMRKLYTVLLKMEEVADFMIKDLSEEVAVKEDEYKLIKTSHKALSSAMSAINGDPDKRAVFEQTLEYMQEDMANKIGTMERFMQMSQTFIESVDVENGVFEQKALDMLDQYEKDGFETMFNDMTSEKSFRTLPESKTEYINNVPNFSEPVKLEAKSVGEKNSWENLL